MTTARVGTAAPRTSNPAERTATETPRTAADQQPAEPPPNNNWGSPARQGSAWGARTQNAGWRAGSSAPAARTVPPPAAPATSDGVAFNKLEALAKGDVGVAGVKNPPALHKVTWTPLGDYLKDQGLSNAPVGIFPQVSASDPAKIGEAYERTIIQGDIGNCYQKSAISAFAKNDPALLHQVVREVGAMPNGSKLYGVVMMVEKDKQSEASRFQRAGNDVTHSVSMADPSDPSKTIDVQKTFTPVWVVVSDELPVEKDGKTLNSSDPVVKGQDGEPTQVVLFNFLIEKAQAKLHGEYRDLDNGGDAAQAMQELSGFPAETIDVQRKKDPDADRANAVKEFNAIKATQDRGGSFVVGTWGNAPDHRNEKVTVNDSITRVIREFPQYRADGSVAPEGRGFFKPDFEFLDGSGSADHGNRGGPKESEGRGSVGDHDFGGHGAYIRDGGSPDKPGDMMISFRNPWGDTRPDKFADGKTFDDGILQGHYLQLRTLIGTYTMGGRPQGERAGLTGVTAPVLPQGATSTFRINKDESR
jgi:hypothetical protein